MEVNVAKAIKKFSVDENGMLSLFTSEMHLLGAEINAFVKNDVAKLRNKLG